MEPMESVERALQTLARVARIGSQGEIIGHAIARDEDGEEFGQAILWRLNYELQEGFPHTDWAVAAIDDLGRPSQLYARGAGSDSAPVIADEARQQYGIAARSIAFAAREGKTVLSWEFPAGEPVIGL
ncbi:hypothetical protein [Streptomyces sp. NPDC048636]|uniref:hypothetical protein n=1 Tax=Streptomyces sp. NPDC048636 TaxID=3155762 RepID=UPI00342505EC